jgi:hypothetical protein
MESPQPVPRRNSKRKTLSAQLRTGPAGTNPRQVLPSSSTASSPSQSSSSSSSTQPKSSRPSSKKKQKKSPAILRSASGNHDEYIPLRIRDTKNTKELDLIYIVEWVDFPEKKHWSEESFEKIANSASLTACLNEYMDGGEVAYITESESEPENRKKRKTKKKKKKPKKKKKDKEEVYFCPDDN